MTVDEFVKAIKTQTSDAAVMGTLSSLRRPPGRKPRPRDVELADWFNRLEESDKEMLSVALREAAELAVFSFLCVLDGVSVIEDSQPKGDLELYYAKGSERIKLNDSRQELHGLFNLLCREVPPPPIVATSSTAYESGDALQLKQKLRTADGLDTHTVAASSNPVGDDEPATRPAIALPKAEHRKL